MAREALSSRAIVLRAVPYRDADLILTLYTRERGRLSALARSARKSKRRFGSALQLFTISQLELRSRGGELWTMTNAEPVVSYAQLALDMASYAHASYGTELVRELTAAEQVEPGLFELIVALYDELEQRGPLPMVLRAFELALLQVVGLAPVLDQCVGCGQRALDGPGLVLDPTRGGVCCAVCAALARGVGVRQLSPGALRVLAGAQRLHSLAEARELPVPAASDAAEARDTMVALLLLHIGKPLKSVEFIAKVTGALRRDRQES